MWISCRGSEYVVIRVPGRPGHAEVHQPDWQEGGAVNAIEKATVVIDAIRSLRAEWAGRAGFDHPRLSRPSLLPTMVSAGEWPVTYPAVCELTVAVMYLPVQADAAASARDVRREVEEWITRESAARRLAGRASAGVRVGAERRDAARALRDRAHRRRDASRRAPTPAGWVPSAVSTRGTTAPPSPSWRAFRRSASGRPASTPMG